MNTYTRMKGRRMITMLTDDPFLLRALLAGLGVAAVAGVLGCFVVWRRMAYFGDSLAHSALLGIALGMAAGIGVIPGVVAVCAAFAGLLVWLQQKKLLATDTLLGILAHSALSLGMVAVSLLHAPGLDLQAYLFGDILTVRPGELGWIYGGGTLVLALLILNWPSLVLMTVHEDLARAEGVNTLRQHLVLMFLMTVVVAVSLRVVGILLMTSLLIIPAATARLWTRSPEAMAGSSVLLGMLAVAGGLYASLQWDTPSGPSIVTAAAAMFFLLLPMMALAKRR